MVQSSNLIEEEKKIKKIIIEIFTKNFYYIQLQWMGL